ncbi:diguanylate cyclase (GGDEF)-like protein [Motilibacter peucedani]|uniref:Diguanylate cyclase (GGDEF)-like protein n=1 Tax=Motilibacter peucedani TaxID=598650 RepID=A0A420XJY0_9ACTN|nr:bifunctional diguanylate cyclase/phosphodiesterase [Motilibacter peucedani]RKS68032.1 diguanylate cyclase (GGDEF)-like protein [Motilibacter peucedani]
MADAREDAGSRLGLGLVEWTPGPGEGPRDMPAPAARLAHADPALAALLGRPGEDLAGVPAEQVLAPPVWTALRTATSSPVEATLPRPTGPGLTVVLHWSLQGPGRLLLAVEDVTSRRRLLRSLQRKALYDPLTGLPNRVLFLEHLEQALRDAQRSGRPAAVAFVDVDDLKAVNEVLGHEAGDELLITVAHRLRRSLRASDVAGRLSGDEFAVVCPRLNGAQELSAIGERLLTTVAGACMLGGREVAASVSVGLAQTGGAPVSSAAALLGHADEALRRAKRRGKRQYVVFDAALDDELRARRAVESELSDALAGGQLRVHYQPVVDLTAGRVVGAEALLRWQHPVRGLLGPDEFLPLAEDTGAIVELGRWVLDQACAQAALWRAQRPGVTVAVNVSPRQLGRGDVALAVEESLERHGLDPGGLRIEVTESALTESSSARSELWEIDASGVPVGIDDFGTGYASLSYLRQLPVGFIKIDRSFVADMVSDPDQHAIVASVTSLALALGIGVVAEGVETGAQAEALVALGCTTAQGFLYARPMPAEELALLSPGRVGARAGS